MYRVQGETPAEGRGPSPQRGSVHELGVDPATRKLSDSLTLVELLSHVPEGRSRAHVHDFRHLVMISKLNF